MDAFAPPETEPEIRRRTPHRNETRFRKPFGKEAHEGEESGLKPGRPGMGGRAGRLELSNYGTI